jgi:glycolate oxidase FAD binding subunit
MTGAVHRPSTEAELADLVGGSFAAAKRLEIRGGGSKRAMAGSVDAEDVVETTGLSGITLYEPSELVIGAAAGTRLAFLTETLEANGQMLAFEPADYRGLLASEAMEPTVGGLVATNLSGPRRVVAGACRDAMIGIRFVNGRGEVIKSGGRVMKNVTGYDLTKLLAGSWGTLGVVTEAIFKVVPKPETSASLIWHGLADDVAVALLSAALGSPYEVSAAAHVPATSGERARTIVRLENFARSVTYRRERLARDLAEFGPCDVAEADRSVALWASLRDVGPLVDPSSAVWRVSVAPSKACGVARSVAAATDATCLYDWGGGLLWIAVAQSMGAGRAVKLAAEAAGGHVMLLRASDDHRRDAKALLRKSGPLGELTQRIKAAFDPACILNPGRFVT